MIWVVVDAAPPLGPSPVLARRRGGGLSRADDERRVPALAARAARSRPAGRRGGGEWRRRRRRCAGRKVRGLARPVQVALTEWAMAAALSAARPAGFTAAAGRRWTRGPRPIIVLHGYAHEPARNFLLLAFAAAAREPAGRSSASSTGRSGGSPRARASSAGSSTRSAGGPAREERGRHRALDGRRGGALLRDVRWRRRPGPTPDHARLAARWYGRLGDGRSATRRASSCSDRSCARGSRPRRRRATRR